MSIYNSVYAKSSEFWTTTNLFVWKKVEQKLVKDKLDIKKGDKILEIGCNTGRFTSEVVRDTKCQAHAIDFNEYAVKQAKKNFPKFNFQKMDATAMKFKTNFFDKIFSLHVLEHIPNYNKLLKEVHRTLKKHGVFVLAVPTERIKGDLALGGLIFTGKNGHIHKFNYPDLSKELIKTGFKIKSSYLCIGFPFTAVNMKKIKYQRLASFFSYSMVFVCRKNCCYTQ